MSIQIITWYSGSLLMKRFVYLYLCVCFFVETVSGSPNWPWCYYVGRENLEFLIPPSLQRHAEISSVQDTWLMSVLLDIKSLQILSLKTVILFQLVHIHKLRGIHFKCVYMPPRIYMNIYKWLKIFINNNYNIIK